MAGANLYEANELIFTKRTRDGPGRGELERLLFLFPMIRTRAVIEDFYKEFLGPVLNFFINPFLVPKQRSRYIDVTL